MHTPRQTDRALVALLWITGLFAAAQFGKISLTLALLGERYATAGSLLPFTVSVVGIMGILFGPIAGGIVTRIGLRRALLGALMLGAATSALEALGPPLWLFLSLRVVEGASHLALVVALPTLMAESSSDRDRPVVMGLWGTYFGVSFAILALVLPSLVGLGGISAVYASHAVGMIAMAALIAPRLPRGMGERTTFRLGEELRAIYSEPRLIAPALIFVWHAFVYVALLTFLPGALGHVWLGVVLPLVSLAGTMGAGVLARTITPARIAVVAFTLNGVIAAAMLVLPALQVPLAILLFMTLGLVPGAGFAAIPWLNRLLGERARSNGAVAQLGNVGTFSGTPVFALALVWGGSAGLLVLLVGVSFVGFIIASVISRRFRSAVAA
ncbi:MFS transporter [Pelagovum pacificum]|uniref:MFS transporter n=1 Tax=Pelagovum pacificum TaxID=2588711 RepID=A0A5C5GFR1_9RHOB|nr:MFS transporter [Pelagovum pacificum]QQA44488.1 MFS transporter [Pelagovum pacificum]TNY32396.1 MFS transporter [Pelagovum pacificum]